MVEKGELGGRLGNGFYNWTLESAIARKNRITEVLIRLIRYSGMD